MKLAVCVGTCISARQIGTWSPSWSGVLNEVRSYFRSMYLAVLLSVADPGRFGLDPDPVSENRPDSDPDPVKTGSGFI